MVTKIIARIAVLTAGILLAAGVWAGGPFSLVPRSHWAYPAMVSLQEAGLFDLPDFRDPAPRTRYEFSTGLRRALQRLETLTAQAEGRSGQALASSGQRVGLSELQALQHDCERLLGEFGRDLQGVEMGPEEASTLFLRLQSRLSTLEWRESQLEVRSLPAAAEGTPAAMDGTDSQLPPGWLMSPSFAGAQGFTPVPVTLDAQTGLTGALLIAPPSDPDGNPGWGAGAALPLGSWGTAELTYLSSNRPDSSGLLGARLSMNLAGLDMDVGYVGLDLQGLPLSDAPSLLTAQLRRRWEGFTMTASYQRASAGLGTSLNEQIPDGWNDREFQSFAGGLSYSNPHLDISYQYQHYLSVADLNWGRGLAALDYYGRQGLALQLRYEHIQGNWARWQQETLSSLSAGLQWQVSPKVEFRLLHRLPAEAGSTRLRPTEGITFSEFAVHF